MFALSADLPQPKLSGLTAEPVIPPVDELAAKPPQTPVKDATSRQPSFRPPMEDPEHDPWGSPSAHRDQPSVLVNGPDPQITNGRGDFGTSPPAPTHARQFSSSANHPNAIKPSPAAAAAGPEVWGYFDGSNNAAPSMGDNTLNTGASPFGGVGPTSADLDRSAGSGQPFTTARTTVTRSASGVEESVLVTLMPEKEGVFMFQHHNYEITSQRRGSKVIRRYSDFVWLLDCLQKRFPFRMLPLLPPKRVSVNGNHLSNDGSFIEKRRRGLARFLNALIRHPILGQEQLVVMFLTVPTVSYSLS